MRGSNVLITGGAGFIGSHLTEYLLHIGCNVTVADNLSRGSYEYMKAIKKHVEFLPYDLRDENKAVKACKDKDIVYNLAALNTGIDYDSGRTQEMFEENILLQMIPLRAAAKCGVKKFVQISSASIYSKDAMERRVPTKEEDDGGEPEPSKLGYALAKRMGEKLAEWYSLNNEIHTVRARFINVYGPRDHFDSKGHFIPIMIKKFIDEKITVEVFGSGNQCRSFIHVQDVVSALDVLAQKGKRGEVYNVDSQDEFSVKDVVRLIQKDMKKSSVQLLYNTSLPEGSRRRMLDNSRIKALGWIPKYTLPACLPDVIGDIQRRWKQ
jgi:nucleoside-diphosphate-sugar epimerase